MYSTLRVLRKQNIFSVDLLTKGSNCSFHVCSKRNFVPSKRIFCKHKAPLGIASINSFKFNSTDSTATQPQEVIKQNQIIEETIPEPPPPLSETPLVNQAHLQNTIYERTLEEIPIPPEVLRFKETVFEALAETNIPIPPEAGVDPPFDSLGLGGWSPVGIVQNCLEFLHVSCDLPWWGTIVAGTIVVRTLVFPLVIISQRNAAKMSNHLPEMQAIQLKMSDARERGDKMEAAKYAEELMTFMKTKQLSPFKNVLVPLAQAPLFISFFMGLRQMASLPVESLRNGGIWWFTDLTLTDQFYLLPIITSLTLAVTIEVGADAARTANLGMMKYVLRVMPIFIFPFTINFPSAILVYWTSTNFISLLQVSFLKIPKIRTYFKIDPIVKHDVKKLPIKDKGFVTGVKDTWTNMKITRELEDRKRVDEMNFMRAGRGAVMKTYKIDPTRSKPPQNVGAIQAKKRD